jgi:hypothetical protein
MTRYQQDRLIDFAARHFAHAEAREEGDVALFCEATVRRPNGSVSLVTEIEVCESFEQLVAALGY